MAYNKVELDGSTIIDLSTDTAVAADVLSGKTFHTNTGEEATGTIGNLTSSNITFSGNQVSVAKGKYTNATVTKTIPAGTEGTPTVSIGTSTRSTTAAQGYVTTSAHVTNTAGYISGGSHSNNGPQVFVTNLIPENMTSPDPTEVISGKEYINGDGLVRVGTMVNHPGDVNVNEVTSDAQSSSGKIYFEIPEDGYYSDNNGLAAPISDVKDAYNTANSNVIAAGNIKSGVNIMGVTGTYSGLVPSGKKTLTDLSETDVSSYATAQVDGTNIVSGNIKKGVTILGVSGSDTVVDTSDATAQSDDIAILNTAYVNGQKVTGSLPNMKAVEVIPNSSEVTKTANGLNYKPNAGDFILGELHGLTINNDIIANKGGISANQILAGNTYYGVMGSIPQFTTDKEAEVSADENNGPIYLLTPESGYYEGYGITAFYAAAADVRDAYNSANGNVIAAGNIKSGVNIMGVTGTYSPAEVNLQNKTLAASALNLSSGTQTVNPDSGYDGMTSVVITKPTTLISDNIKSGVTVAGVTGSYTGLVPSGTITLTNLNATDVTNYASARVDGTNITPDNIKSGVTILGVTGTHVGGGPRKIKLKNSGYSTTYGYVEHNGTKYYTSGQEITVTDGDIVKFAVNSSGSVYLNGVLQTLSGSRTKTFDWTVDSDASVLFDGHSTIKIGRYGYVYNQDKTVVSNGTTTADNSYDGLGTVTVNIPEWDGTVV